MIFHPSGSIYGDIMKISTGCIYGTKKGKHVLIIAKSGKKNYECIHIMNVQANNSYKIKYDKKSVFADTSKITTITVKEIIKKVGELSGKDLGNILRIITGKYAKIYFKNLKNKNNYLSSSGKKLDAGDLKYMVDSCLDMNLTISKYNSKFEDMLAKIIGLPHCMTVNSGSSANLLALSALTSPVFGDRRLKPGDEVITLAASFPTTVTPILQNGLIPVFVDLTIPFYNADTSQLDAAVSPKTRAVIFPHTLGNPFDINAVKAFTKKHGLWLIEDNCEALDSRYDGKPTGSFGDISTCSFYPAHQITTGEGGAVFTGNPDIHRIMISMRDWGRDCRCLPGEDNSCKKRFGQEFEFLPAGYDHKYIYSNPGYNMRMTDMQAALGFSQLQKINKFTETRKRNFNLLYDGLKKYEEDIILPEPTPLSDPSWFGFPLTLRNDKFKRADLIDHLEKNNIGTRLLFAGNILRHPLFVKNDYNLRIVGSESLRSSNMNSGEFSNLKNSEKVLNDTFWIGIWHGLTEKNIRHISKQFEKFFDK
jgi:CDP-4-dehydro-6-deoxyglucose reductase, E1